MAGSNTTSSTARKKSGSTNKPNRAQLRAAEIRAAESVGVVGGTAAVATGAVAVNRRSIGRNASRAVTLTWADEMRYVRSDLRRLLYTAGVLFVLMIALLFILD